MGGHGALVCALRNPGRYRSVSAFSPISNPMDCPWGEKAFSRYLGEDRGRWREWDASVLLAETPAGQCPPLLVDQATVTTSSRSNSSLKRWNRRHAKVAMQ